MCEDRSIYPRSSNRFNQPNRSTQTTRRHDDDSDQHYHEHDVLLGQRINPDALATPPKFRSNRLASQNSARPALENAHIFLFIYSPSLVHPDQVNQLVPGDTVVFAEPSLVAKFPNPVTPRVPRSGRRCVHPVLDRRLNSGRPLVGLMLIPSVPNFQLCCHVILPPFCNPQYILSTSSHANSSTAIHSAGGIAAQCARRDVLFLCSTVVSRDAQT